MSEIANVRRAYYAAQPRGRIRDWIFLLWCVLVPAAVVLFEAATHFCARMFFNPMPTLWHCGLALMVPVANAVVWWVTGQEKPRRLRWLGLLNGAAIGVAVYYSVIFAPLLPMAVRALLLLGMGLLPMAPLFSLIGAVRCRRRLTAWSATAQRVEQPTGKGRPVPGLWAGLAGALAVLAALQVPAAVTHYGLKQAASADPAERKAGLALLRRWGNHQAMTHACQQWDSFDLLNSPLSYLASDATPVSPVQARETFYRVTGRAYSRSAEARSRWSRWEDDWDQWDDEENESALRGGEEVGGLVKGLSLASSQIDGTVYADAGAAYFEWTMEFRNETGAPQEARARVALPAGGVVSRVTLWIDGEEREAAFGPGGLVRAAYEQVAVVQRRDPLLVTTAGRDAVQAQCFPVPPHGSMKVRLGVTAPMQLSEADGERDGPVRETVALPALSERNLAIAAGGAHAVHVTSATPLSATAPSLPAAAVDGSHQPYGLRGTIEPFRPEGPVLLKTEGRVPAALVAEDPFDAGIASVAVTQSATRPAGAARELLQRLDRTIEPAPSRLVLVVDASASMGPSIEALCDELPILPTGLEVSAIVAADDVVELAPSAGAVGGGGAEVARQLRRFPARGGQDAVPALSRAWEKAWGTPGSVVLWIHGTQPVLLQPVDPNQPWIRRGSGDPRLLELATSVGPNKVAEALAEGGAWEAVPRAGGVREDLHELFAGWAEARPRLRLVRERYAREDAESVAAAPLAEGQAKQQADPAVARLVSQLWAADEVRRRLDQQPAVVAGGLREPGPLTSSASAAADLAVSHRLVTPVSGAVVLETKQQYEQAGLKAPEVQTVPLPPTVLLMLTAVPMVAVGYYLHRRQGRRT